MLDLIMKLFGYIDINKIKIPGDYKIPTSDKLRCKMNFYTTTGKYQDQVVINKENIILDGYITYLLCKWASKKYIKVIVMDCDHYTYKTLYRGYKKRFTVGIDIGNEKDKTVIIKNDNWKGKFENGNTKKNK